VSQKDCCFLYWFCLSHLQELGGAAANSHKQQKIGSYEIRG